MKEVLAGSTWPETTGTHRRHPARTESRMHAQKPRGPHPRSGTETSSRAKPGSPWERFGDALDTVLKSSHPVSRHMSEPGHRIYGTTTVRVSLVIHAPLRYVYEWCTDYRSDDGRFSRRRPHPSFRVIKISPRRVLRIRVARGTGRDSAVAVDLVRLNPPTPGTSTRSTRPTGRPWTTGSAPSAARGHDFSCW
jgi:hypothetical protein